MVNGNDELFTEAKWYLVSPINTALWSVVVTDWIESGIQAASDAVFHNYIYKLHEPVGHGETLTRESWDQIDISVAHDPLVAGIGYFVKVEVAGTTYRVSSLNFTDENGSKRSQSAIKLYSLETKDTYIEIKKADGSTIDEVTDESGNITIPNISFPRNKMIKIESFGGVSDDTIVPNDSILEEDEDLYDDEDVEQKRIIIEPFESIINSNNNNKPIVSNSIKELASELFITNINNDDNIDNLKTKLEQSKTDVATSFDMPKEDMDKEIEETTNTKLLDGIRKLKILQDTFIALDDSVDDEENFDERNKKLLQIKKGVVNTIKEKPAGEKINFTNDSDIEKIVGKIYDNSSSDPDRLKLDDTYTNEEKDTVRENKKLLIKEVFTDLDGDNDLNNEVDKSEKEKKFKIKQKEWKAQFRKRRKNKGNKKDFEKEPPTNWINARPNLKPVRDNEKNNIQCLFRQTTGASSEANIIDVINSKYEFNDIPYDTNNKIAVGRGEYTIENVSQDYPIGFRLKKQRYYNKIFTVVSGTESGVPVDVDGIIVQHYYGNVTIRIRGNFGRASYHCANDGYMGGRKKLIYSNKCKDLTPPSIGIVVELSGNITGTNNTKLKSNETVVLAISPDLDQNDRSIIFWEKSIDESIWSPIQPQPGTSLVLTNDLINYYIRAILTVNRRDGFSLKKLSNVRQVEEPANAEDSDSPVDDSDQTPIDIYVRTIGNTDPYYKFFSSKESSYNEAINSKDIPLDLQAGNIYNFIGKDTSLRNHPFMIVTGDKPVPWSQGMLPPINDEDVPFILDLRGSSQNDIVLYYCTLHVNNGMEKTITLS